MTKRIKHITLALVLACSIGCNKAPVATDPTQPPGETIAQKFEREAARAERIEGYARIIRDKALPIYAGIRKLTPERQEWARTLLTGLESKANAAAPALRRLAAGAAQEGREQVQTLIEEMTKIVKALADEGLLLFPETEAGQRLESLVRVALALLPEAIEMLKEALR